MKEPVKVENIMKVYSGRKGKCACGCSGTYRYASVHREMGAIYTGREIDDEDVNDKQVRKVVNIINKNLENAEVDKDGVTLTIGERLYFAVFTLTPEEIEETKRRQAEQQKKTAQRKALEMGDDNFKTMLGQIDNSLVDVRGETLNVELFDAEKPNPTFTQRQTIEEIQKHIDSARKAIDKVLNPVS
jgi:hypothetical protein